MEAFFWSIPPVTRALLVGCVLTTLAVHIDLVPTLSLYLNWPLILKGHVWRLLTTFLFFDYFGLNFMLSMYFLLKQSWNLEQSFTNMADYVYMWLLCGSWLLGASALIWWTRAMTSMTFLGPAFSFVIVYVWSRRNPHLWLNFLGLFDFQAPYLPWVFLVFGVALGQRPDQDLLGIAVGHVYYYFKFVYPLRRNRHPLRTPEFLQRLLVFQAARPAPGMHWGDGMRVGGGGGAAAE